MSSVQEEKPAMEGPKTRIQDLRNTELVSRLLAATPPYLYSALPLQPHAFFFSEMLRSFVSARHGCRPPHYHRRFKRRSHKYFAENDDSWQQRRPEWPKQDEEKKEQETIRPEVPLELTVEKHPRMREVSPKRMSPKAKLPKSSGSPGPPGRPPSFVDVGTEEGLSKPVTCLRNPEVPPTNLILPPPPPMWYPPIYNPQFGVDPLNFFIDLRVSGHIYDRKRMMDGTDPTQSPEMKVEEPTLEKDLGRELHRPRHLSAFSVPVRSGASSAIGAESPTNYMETESERLAAAAAAAGRINNTSYIMRNLKNVYDNMKSPEDMKEDKIEKDEDSKGDSSDLNDEDIVD